MSLGRYVARWALWGFIFGCALALVSPLTRTYLFAGADAAVQGVIGTFGAGLMLALAFALLALLVRFVQGGRG